MCFFSFSEREKGGGAERECPPPSKADERRTILSGMRSEDLENVLFVSRM
jgi:hypothetical protein